MKKMFSLRKGAMVWTDKRAKMIQELLGGMRIIKFFAWEVPYLKKIAELRRQELRKIRGLLMIRALTMAIAMSLPVIATIIAFTAFAYTGGNSRDPATIFTSLTLFNLLRMPLMLMPVSLATAVSSKIPALKHWLYLYPCEPRIPVSTESLLWPPRPMPRTHSIVYEKSSWPSRLTKLI